MLKRKTFYLIAFLLIGLLLSGCLNAETNIMVYGDSQWQGVQSVQLSAEMSQMLDDMEQMATDMGEGGMGEKEFSAEIEQAFGEELGGEEIDTSDLEDWTERAQRLDERSDIQATFSEGQNPDGTYYQTLEAQGNSLDTLNEIFFENRADITTEMVGGEQQITIRYMVYESEPDVSDSTPTPAELEMGSNMAQAMGFQNLLRFTAGKIIRHNATRLEGNTAIWENPTEVIITFTPAESFESEALALSGVAAAPAGEQPEQAQAPAEPTPPPMEAEEPPLPMEAEPEAVLTEEDMEVAEGEGEAESAPAETEGEAAPAPAETEGEAMAEEAVPAETGPETVSDEAASLPDSGAVLPGNVSGTVLVLAGLVLLILSVGGVISLRHAPDN